MKKMFLGLICFFLSGCIGTAGLQARLETRQGELSYLHDSHKNVEKKGGTLKIKSFVVDDILPPAIMVKKTAGSVIPLLFVNIWKEKYQCALGYAQIANDYKQFIQESFIEELKRSGSVEYAADKGDIELDIRVKSVEISAPVQSGGNFLFLLFVWSYRSYALAGPVDVTISADVVLNKKGVEVFHKGCEGKYSANILKRDMNVSINRYLEDYTPAMIEGLSFAIKDLNEKIVKEINQT